MKILNLTEGLWRLESRCLRTLIGTNSEQQQMDKELWGFFLVMRRL